MDFKSENLEEGEGIWWEKEIKSMKDV